MIDLLFATWGSRYAVAPEVVVTVGLNALLFRQRGYTEPPPQAYPAPRYQCARGLTAKIDRDLLVANSKAPESPPLRLRVSGVMCAQDVPLARQRLDACLSRGLHQAEGDISPSPAASAITNAAIELTPRSDGREPVRFVRFAQPAVDGSDKAEVGDGLGSLLQGNGRERLDRTGVEYRRRTKDVMSSPSDPTCRDLLSSSVECVRAGLVTVELEEAPCEHRNGT